MFHKLRVKNFHSIRDSDDLRFSRLNVFVGPNNAGKSSLLYSLLLLKQTLEDKDRRATLVTSGPHVDLGSYLDIIRGHQAKRKLGLAFELEQAPTPISLLLKFPKVGEKAFEPFTAYDLRFSFNAARNTVEVDAFTATSRERKSAYKGTRKEDGWAFHGIPRQLEGHLSVDFDHFLPAVRPVGKGPKEEKTREEGIRLFFAFSLQTQEVRRMFDRLLYVGPIRERIPRYGILGTMPYTELGPSGQNLLRVLSQVGKRGRSMRSMIQELDHWLDKKFRILKNVTIHDLDKGKTVKAILADDPRGEKKINLAAMGTGLSQIVPVIVQTVLTPQDGCLIVEQPEIHLHPAAQATLADLFVEYTRKEKGPQFIIETHSEHFVLRIRRRIAEGKLPPNRVTIFFVQKERGQTKVRQLKLRRNGQFVRWPRGFFEEGYKEAMALAEAQVR